ncbi:S-phase kinase-associated protein 1 [Trichinella pseudospiralis]|uniref:Skp1-related protein n=1 Tax=Trichinella pseudospiralis TaxID=6337 RepID=A0A0V1HIA4_TRIPS|nr:S-phase kinase-associated protein 1 [Trichinella pseudospiralis]KRY70518.1 S-phase kinase-associated protein 1 [Trichinella pseudospiralis]KRZ09876.1 S-phase kinase-associated protein 1 [Trichinella pseudospiralis]KRZ39124.1 S-phase kinase-associated protein 1 [Trichinella pseudospiralis]
MDNSVSVVSGDGKVFEVDIKAIQLSKTVKTMLEDLRFDGDQNIVEAIPLPNVNASVLEKILLYCEHHKNDMPEKEENRQKKQMRKEEMDVEEFGIEQLNLRDECETEVISEWDKTFLDVDQGTLFDIILAANYLEIKPLLDVACLSVARMMKGKTPEEIRNTFNIKNDFTPEELEQIRHENAWCE